MVENPKKAVATASLCYVLGYIECPVAISSKNQGVKPGEVVGKSSVRDFFVDNGCCHPAENND